jgi:ElaB/YqjD/DUF883 family membrane-anchored ribosome-binding protein
MDQEPQELRQDIDRTRREMDRTLDQIQERVTPSRIVQRRADRLRGTVTGVRERVMGTAGDVRDASQEQVQRGEGRLQDVQGQVGEISQQAREAVQHAPQAARERTRGNPLAAGLIAFGAGLLAGSLLPESRREQELAEQAREHLEPVRQELTAAGKEVAEELKHEAQAKAEETKETVSQAADAVRADAQGAADDLQQEAKARGESVRERAQG